jgi:hypothetical protein
MRSYKNLKSCLGIIIGTLVFNSAIEAKSPISKRSDWISLYAGTEAAFSNKDRDRVLSVLKAFGIDYQIDAKYQMILIAPENKVPAQDLISKLIFRISTNNKEKP